MSFLHVLQRGLVHPERNMRPALAHHTTTGKKAHRYSQYKEMQNDANSSYANSAASTPTLATAFTTKGALLKLLLPPHRRVGVQVSVV